MTQLVEKTQRRLRSFLERTSHPESLRSFLESIEGTLPGSGIFGGMVRDFALDSVEDFSSDIDVVTTAPAEEIFSVIRRFEPRRNKYGGFRFSFNGRAFDIWSLKDTWAVREGHVEAACLADLQKTTFFNLDAALFVLGQRKVLASVSYEVQLMHRLLDINLLSHPAPERMAVRAISMALQKNLLLSPQLSEFVLRHADVEFLPEIYRHFHEELRRHFVRDTENPFCYQRQLEIWPRPLPYRSFEKAERRGSLIWAYCDL